MGSIVPIVPDWISKTLSVLAALSGWFLLAMTVALAVVLFAPTPEGIDLATIRQEWGGWIFAALVVFGCLAIARFTQWASSTVGIALERRRGSKDEELHQQREREREEAEQARQQRHRAEYERDEGGGVVAAVDDLPGFFAQGETHEEARANLEEVIEGNIMLALQLGWDVPPLPGIDIREQDVETDSASS